MPPDFDLGEVADAIAPTRFSGLLHHLRAVGSTNQLALEAAQSGAHTGVWIADEQLAGRGRGGHTWHSAPGDGLLVSALVTLPIPLADATRIPLATGLAAQAAVLEVTGLALDIRWPNDLMLGPGPHPKKCGGILVESASDQAQTPTLRYAVIGVGLNINQPRFPPDLAPLATSLHLESGRTFRREPILAALLLHLDRELTLLSSHASAPGLLLRFEAASSWARGKRVRVEEHGGYTGFTCGLDPSGFLLVRGDDGVTRTVLSGGVRPA